MRKLFTIKIRKASTRSKKDLQIGDRKRTQVLTVLSQFAFAAKPAFLKKQ